MRMGVYVAQRTFPIRINSNLFQPPRPHMSLSLSLQSLLFKDLQSTGGRVLDGS